MLFVILFCSNACHYHWEKEQSVSLDWTVLLLHDERILQSSVNCLQLKLSNQGIKGRKYQIPIQSKIKTFNFTASMKSSSFTLSFTPYIFQQQSFVGSQTLRSTTNKIIMSLCSRNGIFHRQKNQILAEFQSKVSLEGYCPKTFQGYS